MEKELIADEQHSKQTDGYVYILGVKDIDLPVCKIGMTTRSPPERCKEINNSSTGDFIWEVSYQVYVSDCRALEALAHIKLAPLKQRKREFINLSPDDAYRALRSIMDTQKEVQEIPIQEKIIGQDSANPESKPIPKNQRSYKKVDSQYATLLQEFTSLLGVKGRPFGQLNKPVFGISDGNQGVQWNLAIFTDLEEARLGVNLEGMEYQDWPIAKFILSELDIPKLREIVASVKDPEKVYLQFKRDAWQVNSRPYIVEEYIGGRPYSMVDLKPSTWSSILNEALDCLNKEKRFRGRARQIVTLRNQPITGERTRPMWVSPHLTVWTTVQRNDKSHNNLKTCLKRLKPVIEWVRNASE